tara:strand:- start:462 stop:1520 length:1059 start_codon:yes stop_codon:yes gene_type:complete
MEGEPEQNASAPEGETPSPEDTLKKSLETQEKETEKSSSDQESAPTNSSDDSEEVEDEVNFELKYSESSLDDILSARKELYESSEEFRAQRDELNLKSQENITSRNSFNTKVKELMESVEKHRETRNTLNEKVAELKSSRKEATNKAEKLRQDFLDLKKSKFANSRLPPIFKIRKELKELEIKQMTTPLTTSKERGLVEKIGLLQQQIREYNEMLDSDSDVAEARSNYKDSEKSRKIILKEMNQTRQEAQREHDQMYRDLKKSRSTRKKADSYQRAFIKSKTEADGIHENYIELLKEIQAIDRIIGDRRKATSSPGEATETMASADELYQKFLGGDKLTTNELMVIQKAGLL